MDVLTLILVCSFHPDDELVRVLIDVAGRENTYFVGDVSTLATYEKLSSLEEARRTIAEIQRKGGRPAVGLMGVPLPWAARFGRGTMDLFDGCTNIAIATSVLSGYERECRASLEKGGNKQRRSRSLPAEVLRPCTLRRYGHDLGIAGYTEAILKLLAEQKLKPAEPPMDSPAQRSPVFIDGSDESAGADANWSSSHLFLQTGTHVATFADAARP